MTRPTDQSPTQTSQRLATVTQSGNTNSSATVVPLNEHKPLAAGKQKQNPNIPINLHPNTSVNVDGAGLDKFVPVIPEARTEDTKELFKVNMLPNSKSSLPTTEWRRLRRNSAATL